MKAIPRPTRPGAAHAAIEDSLDSTSPAGDAVSPAVPQSATLAINEKIKTLLAEGRPVIHLGFGEAGLPVTPELVERLRQAAGGNDYRPSTGSPALREAIAGFYTRRSLPTTPEQVVAAPGSKALLFALLRVLPGDVVLPAPSWVSYAAQVAVIGKRLGWANIPGECGGVPDPDALRNTVRTMRNAGGNPGVLVLTTPDNPTGTLASRELLTEVCRVAADEGLRIIADEIYRDLAYDQTGVSSIAQFLPESTFTTGGLSKNLALGGWRIGFARFPETSFGESVRRAVVGIASEIWSSTAAPMEDAATWALGDPEPIRARIEQSRRLHGTISRAVHRVVEQSGAECRRPTAAFYLYPDLSVWRQGFAALGLNTDEQVARWLLDTHQMAVLPGSVFGDDPGAMRFRLATSLLYGRTPERREQALASDDPAALPWISAALEQVQTVFATLSKLA